VTLAEYPAVDRNERAMDESYSEILARVHEYALCRERLVLEQLGWGWDGLVVQSEILSAIKGFRYEPQYVRERDVYLRLRERGIRRLLDFSVPTLIDYDDDLMVVEMGIVYPPYVIDFAGARLDSPPDFSDEIMEEWEAEKTEQFEDDWPQVRELVYAFQGLGIYLGDVHPGNIRLRNE
jgi:hypothetical protein